MASMREIKRRRNSIQSIQQITKAMKLVSTVKLQKSRGKAEEAKPYFNAMYRTVQSILKRSGGVEHRYLRAGESGKKGILVLSSNRGLAGGYNANVARMVMECGIQKEDALLYTVGRKARETLEKRGYPVEADYSGFASQPDYSDAQEIGQRLLKDFEDGKLREIYLVYTAFKNTVVHEAKVMKLLPVELEEETGSFASKTSDDGGGREGLMEYEPGEEEVLDYMIPTYLTSIIFGALNEAAASENGARMQAMDSATTSAEEIMNELSVKYNRARQASITQELTEIIAGAESLQS